MGCEEVKEWLDRLIANRNETESLRVFNSQIIHISPCDSIQLYIGIEIVADLIGVELKENKRDDNLYPYDYSFEYKGQKFRQISAKRLGAYARAD